MAKVRGDAVQRHIRALFGFGTLGGMTDGQLLERFTAQCGAVSELAFALLVERHGPMVLRVCRRVLADPHDAHDAFQATFLVLVQQAGSVRKRESLASWLHGVAFRVASRAKSAAARRRLHEFRRAEMASLSLGHGERNDIGPVLHEELDRLPNRYRAAIVLCDLEGQTYEQAAQQLQWPVGTVKSRLSRGREQLRGRLIRRGLVPAVGMLGAMLTAESASATLAPTLVGSTVRAASQLAAGRMEATGYISSLVTAQIEGVRKLMFLSRLKTTGIALFAISATAVATSVIVGASNRAPRDERATGTASDIREARLRTEIQDAVRAVAAVPFEGRVDVIGGTFEGHPKIRGLVILGLAQAKVGDRAAAHETLAHAVRLAEIVQPEYYRAGILARAARAQAKVGDEPAARDTVRKSIAAANAQGGTWRTDALTAIVSAQMTLGDREAARSTLQILREVAPKEEMGPDDGKDALLDLSRAAARTGDYEEAIEWLDVASRRAAEAIGDPRRAERQRQSWKDEALVDIVSIAAEQRDYPRALRFAEAIMDEANKGGALYHIASSQARSGDSPEAMAWIGKIASPRLRAKALDGLATGLVARAGCELEGLLLMH